MNAVGLQDTLLFSRLKTWEIGKFSNLPISKREDYIESIKNRLKSKEEEKDKIVVQEKNNRRINAYNSDIMQLNWRIEYLSSLNDHSKTD